MTKYFNTTLSILARFNEEASLPGKIAKLNGPCVIFEIEVKVA